MALILSAPLAACGPNVNAVNVTVETYIAAVSLQQVARVLELSAPCQRELLAAATPEAQRAVEKRYRDMIERGYILWENAKATGKLEDEGLGVALIRGIGLGREGGASFPLGVTFADANAKALATTRANTNYDTIRWGNLPTGGRMYLMGHPFGTVVNFATGFDDPSTLKLLATVDLEWSLVRASPAVRRGGTGKDEWLIESLRPLAETATSWSPPAPAGT